MAKLKAKEGTTASKGGPRRDKASEAEAQLRAYHTLGVKVGARFKEGRLDADTLQKLTGETGYGADNIRKARVFAARYSIKQLDDLCRLRTPEGKPLPWRLVRQLLMLPPGEDRDTLQKQAAEKGLSLEEVIAKIPRKVRRGQTRREGGRAFRKPQSLADGLRQVVRHGGEWLRRQRHEAWREFDWIASKPGTPGRGGLAARAAEARATLMEMRDEIKKLNSKIKRLEPEH